MSKNKYYLIARNKTDNSFKIININNSCDKSASLEEIDLYTLNYKKDTSLILDLYTKEKIDNFDIDLFIASRNNDSVDYLELLYNYNESNRFTKLKNVANSSIKGNISESIKDINSLLDDFILKMHNNDNFYRYVNSGCTNVYRKFYNYIDDINITDEDNLKDLFRIKYNDGAWSLKSYRLIRNVTEAIDRFYRTLSYYNQESFTNNMSSRNKIKSKIALETDNNYFEGQISLFDFMNNSKDESSTLDKLYEVKSIFKTIPREAFISNKEGVKFNPDYFSYYADSNYKDILSTKLDNRLLKAVYLYAIHKKCFTEKEARCESTLEIERDLREDLDNIHKMLSKNPKKLNDAYIFCKLYNRCVDDDYEYQRISGIGDKSGYIYTKRKNS
jgi:hypothetical protein